MLPFRSFLKAGRLGERLKLALSGCSLKALWNRHPDPFLHALLSPQIDEVRRDEIMEGFKENDQIFLNFLKEKGYLSEDVVLFSSLAGPKTTTSAFALAGRSYISVASSLHGHVNGEVFGSEHDTFLVRLQVLLHEVGHLEHARMARPFRPTFSLGETQEEHTDMLDNLNRWIYSGLNDNAVHPYKQYSEAFADAYSVMVLLKECPSSHSILSRFVKFRERSVKGNDLNTYAACPHALKAALEVDVSRMTPDDIKHQAAVIASDAWLNLTLSSKSIHELFRLWLRSDLEARAFSFKTATSLLMDPNSLSDIYRKVSDHPFASAFFVLIDSIDEKLKNHPLREKILDDKQKMLVSYFVNEDQRNLILEEILNGVVSPSVVDRKQVDFERTVHKCLHQEWSKFQQDLDRRTRCVEWLKTKHSHRLSPLSPERLRKKRPLDLGSSSSSHPTAPSA